MSSNPELEESHSFTPQFDQRTGLMPVITTDEAGQVLMLAWMNREALDKTVETGTVHYWSRSRSCLWQKGENSGNFQYVKEIRVDCDQDALWIIAEQSGEGACHTGRRTCFYRKLSIPGMSLLFRE